MGHYTDYKIYMKNRFWPWWKTEPCLKCKCVVIDLFEDCPKYAEWLDSKPIYKKEAK